MTSTTLGELLKDFKENSDLTLLEPGEYDLEIVSATAREFDVMPTYKVVAGPYIGKRVMAGTAGSVKGNGPRYAFPLWRQLGLSDEFLQSATLKDVAAALLGRVIRVTLVQDPYKDEMRNKFAKGVKVQLIAAPQGGTVPVGQPAVAAAAAAAPAPVAAAPVAAAPAPVAAAPVAVAAPVAAAPAPVAAAPVAAAPAPVAAAPVAVAAPVAAAPVAVAAPVAAAPVAVAPEPVAPAAPAVAVAPAAVPVDEPSF